MHQTVFLKQRCPIPFMHLRVYHIVLDFGRAYLVYNNQDKIELTHAKTGCGNPAFCCFSHSRFDTYIVMIIVAKNIFVSNPTHLEFLRDS